MQLRGTMWLASLALGLMTVPAVAQAGAPGEGWSKVQALPLRTEVRVRSDHHRSATCVIASVTDEQLTCADRVFPRPEVRAVKLSRKGRSTLDGFLIGAGVGGGAGAGTGVAVKSAFWESSSGKAAGVGALLGILIGGGAGALIGHGADFASTTVYRR